MKLTEAKLKELILEIIDEEDEFDRKDFEVRFDLADPEQAKQAIELYTTLAGINVNVYTGHQDNLFHFYGPSWDDIVKVVTFFGWEMSHTKGYGSRNNNYYMQTLITDQADGYLPHQLAEPYKEK